MYPQTKLLVLILPILIRQFYCTQFPNIDQDMAVTLFSITEILLILKSSSYLVKKNTWIKGTGKKGLLLLSPDILFFTIFLCRISVVMFPNGICPPFYLYFEKLYILQSEMRLPKNLNLLTAT